MRFITKGKYEEALDIIKEYENQQELLKMDFPHYVKFKDSDHTVLRLEFFENSITYIKDAGCWSIGVKVKNGKMFSVNNYRESVNNIELIPAKLKEYKESNYGYYNRAKIKV